MESPDDFYANKARLEWLIELGATEAIGEVPVNRFELPDAVPKPKRQPAVPKPEAVSRPVLQPAEDAAILAGEIAKSAKTVGELAKAMKDFDLCDLRRGARNLVFADGNPAAKIMIIGEAPGRDEDLAGLPFVGRAGQLLDKMFAAIGLSRDSSDAATSVYITNVLPWRPPQNRDPDTAEIAMMLPFLKRHVELVGPEVLVLMGNTSCQALLGRKGISRIRGNWTNTLNRPALPMFHPAYLLRNTNAKREAWHDLLMLKHRMAGGE